MEGIFLELPYIKIQDGNHHRWKF